MNAFRAALNAFVRITLIRPQRVLRRWDDLPKAGSLVGTGDPAGLTPWLRWFDSCTAHHNRSCLFRYLQ
jgi:hypothetical protein